MSGIPIEYWDMAATMIKNYDVSDLPEDKQRFAARLIEDNNEEGLATMIWSMDQGSHQAVRENTMKITKRQLKRIIREEKQKLLREASMEIAYQYASDLIQGVIKDLKNQFDETQLQAAADDAYGSDKVLFELLTRAAIEAGQEE